VFSQGKLNIGITTSNYGNSSLGNIVFLLKIILHIYKNAADFGASLCKYLQERLFLMSDFLGLVNFFVLVTR
jgi:hypothetical protein